MSFIRIPGLTGRLYVPEQDPKAFKKHPCPDCYFCQRCSDTRCRVCLQNQHKNTAQPDKDENPGICKTIQNPRAG